MAIYKYCVSVLLMFTLPSIVILLIIQSRFRRINYFRLDKHLLNPPGTFYVTPFCILAIRLLALNNARLQDLNSSSDMPLILTKSMK